MSLAELLPPSEQIARTTAYTATASATILVNGFSAFSLTSSGFGISISATGASNERRKAALVCFSPRSAGPTEFRRPRPRIVAFFVFARADRLVRRGVVHPAPQPVAER